MARISTVHIRWWSSPAGTSSLPLRQLQFPGPEAGTWQPAINAFRCDHCIRICVDLAGVDRSQIDMEVEPRQLRIRGVRTAPEPTGDAPRARQVLALEIDSGPFARHLRLPAEVDVNGVTAQQDGGLLWIELPLAKST